MPLTWSYGITTVLSRRDTTLPVAINSLREAGFDRPRLFVDGCTHGEAQVYEDKFGLITTTRRENLKPFRHWWLTLVELFCLNPSANRYAIFQDDFITYRNLRPFLERSYYPEKGYLNLFTAFRMNEKVHQMGTGWHIAPPLSSGDRRSPKFQGGKGAVALVFDYDAVVTLLESRSFITKPRAADPIIASRRIDGGVVTAMNQSGWQEFIHSPSLVQHIGEHSTCGNGKHPLAESFRGAEFDAMDLLPKLVNSTV